MIMDKNNTVAELRSELDQKRKRILDMQTGTTDPAEWKALNTLRWGFQDLDNDIYLSQFIKNNDLIEKLIGQVDQAGEEAKKIVITLNNLKETLQKAHEELKKTSAMFKELDAFYTETEALLNVLQRE
jgi:hypothetical protein